MTIAPEPDASLAEALRPLEQQRIYELLSGNQAAWDDFYKEFSPKLLSYFSNKRYNADDCEDLYHETLAVVFAKLSTYDSTNKPLQHWVYGIAKNVWLQRLRKDQERYEHGQEADIEVYQEVADDNQSLDSQDESGISQRQTLQTALAELSDEDQHIIELRLGRDKKLAPWAAIATELGITVSAIKMRYFRAIDRLRAALTARIVPSDS